MKRWYTINKALRGELDEKSLLESVQPFRIEIKKIQKSGGLDVKGAYREFRAQIMEDTRIKLALLDAAACEEDKLEKA